MKSERLTFTVPAQPLIPAHRFVCQRWGSASAARTLFCVHGLTRNSRDFDILAQALANDFQVICPDMPGRGESESLANPALYNYGTYVADAQFILQSLNLSTVDWLGTSMGGIIGMMMANARPGLMRSLILNDVGTFIPAAGLKRILGYAGVQLEFANRAEAEAIIRKNCAPFGIKDEAHWQAFFYSTLEELPTGKVRLRYDPAIAASFDRNNVQDVNLWPMWEAVKKIPVLLIRGSESDILLQATAFDMRTQHPRLTLYEVTGAGHAPALMASEQIETIKNWLKSV